MNKSKSIDGDPNWKDLLPDTVEEYSKLNWKPDRKRGKSYRQSVLSFNCFDEQMGQNRMARQVPRRAKVPELSLTNLRKGYGPAYT